ncbi:MAG: hypothetical protein CSB06_00900 [Bacteroidia bacterium]|nr:MAG: hypothetical protein CSB06_00900 [Bacteroidia bacterium]
MNLNLCKYLWMVTTVTLWATNLTFAQENLTFEEAESRTRTQSHVTKQSEFLKQEKEQELKAARGTFYPKISLSGTYVYMPEDLHMDLTPVKDAITPLYKGLSKYGVFSAPPIPDDIVTAKARKKLAEGLVAIEEGEWDKTLQKQQFASVNLNASLPLFTGGRLHAKRNAAKLDIEDAELEAETKNNQLTTELVKRYFGLYLAKEMENITQEVDEAMKKHLDYAEKMRERGILAQAEVLHAKMHKAQAERNLMKAKRMSKISNRALLTTLNDSSMRDITPISKLFYLEHLPEITHFEQEALANNPSLKKIESKKKLANIGVKVKNAGYMPTVIAMGTYKLWDYQVSEMVPDWTVGVGLSWTLFDGLARERERKSAKLKLAQVGEFQQKTEKDIITGIEKYYQEMLIALEEIHELVPARDFAEEYYRVRQKAFKEGMATSTDVVDANLARVKVKTERLKAAYRFDVALAKLLELCGTSDQFIRYQTSTDAKTDLY